MIYECGMWEPGDIHSYSLDVLQPQRCESETQISFSLS